MRVDEGRCGVDENYKRLYETTKVLTLIDMPLVVSIRMRSPPCTHVILLGSFELFVELYFLCFVTHNTDTRNLQHIGTDEPGLV